MGTRSGDLDPGAIWWILQREGLGAAELSDLVNHHPGLLGVSGISSDMQDLLARESGDAAVADAVEMFCLPDQKKHRSICGGVGGGRCVGVHGGDRRAIGGDPVAGLCGDGVSGHRAGSAGE